MEHHEGEPSPARPERCVRPMRMPSYPPARAVAGVVQAHLEHQALAAAGRQAGDLGAIPDLVTIETIIDSAFWASFRREEGHTPTISLAFLPPGQVVRPLTFEPSLPLEPEALARLAPAVKNAGIHLGVWNERGTLGVWGVARRLPALCFVLEVIAPGLLVLKHSPGGQGKFVNIAVLEGDTVKIVDERGASVPDCPDVVSALLGFGSPAQRKESANVFVQIAVAMRAHGRGGALLVVPGDSDRWLQSIVQPVRYVVKPPFSEIKELVLQQTGERAGRRWQDELTQVVEAVAGLTAVDGATVMNDRHELLAFAVKIARHDESTRIQQVLVTEPVEGMTPSTLHPTQLGGMRHLSAAQFVYDQRDASALVASQDGRFTVFQWSTGDNIVHAHRVEALLL